MAFRLNNVAPPGSLLKGAGRERRSKQRQGQAVPGREIDNAHLDAIRQCPCIVCGIDPAGQAAHIRFSRPDKPNPGVGQKPHDHFTVPLCDEDHRDQHSMGEDLFWREKNIDPLTIAKHLSRVSPNVEAMRAMCFAAQAIGATE
jgi:hypothetical protein